jgi:hypothetical protein
MATLRADPPIGDAEALRRLGSSADLRNWVVHDPADAIVAAAAETPLAIVLEDIHWADSGTLLALRSLATARPDAAVLWVLTVHYRLAFRMVVIGRNHRAPASHLITHQLGCHALTTCHTGPSARCCSAAPAATAPGHRAWSRDTGSSSCCL